LQSTPDILKAVAKIKKAGQVVVGFAVETDNGLANARAKLKAKQLDLIVLNNPTEPGAGFDHETNRVTIIRPRRKPDEWPLMPKYEVAAKLLEIVGRML
ncbi:MAG: bifunctional phosphopantothenoylcysteine decarboxylase/phosphopantothenate--cysteine ligase CoaBC, partial [Candidatus Zixiibacteriota bacterium]